MALDFDVDLNDLSDEEKMKEFARHLSDHSAGTYDEALKGIQLTDTFIRAAGGHETTTILFAISGLLTQGIASNVITMDDLVKLSYVIKLQAKLLSEFPEE